MIKKILTVSTVTAMLLLSGCGDSEGEARLNTQHLLDKGDWDGVITTLENSDTNLSEEDNLLLASAYMGKAGLNLSSFIEIVSDSADNADNADNDDALASLIDGVGKKTTDTALSNLKTASNYYAKVVNVDECNSDDNLTDTQKDICLYMGLSETMKVATTINYIADDVNVLLKDNNNTGSDPKLEASTCAMQYAYDGKMDSECTITNNDELTFENNITYPSFLVIVEGNKFEYLSTKLDDEHNTTLVTNGFCKLDDFTTRVDIKPDKNYHVCPIESESDITIANVLVDALNNGTNTIVAVADDEMKEDIEEFRNDVLDANHKNKGEDITVEDIIAYLNENNK